MITPEMALLWIPVITAFIQNVGFPIVLAGWLLIRLDPQVKAISVGIGKLADTLTANSGTDTQVLTTLAEVVKQNEHVIQMLISTTPRGPIGTPP